MKKSVIIVFTLLSLAAMFEGCQRDPDVIYAEHRLSYEYLERLDHFRVKKSFSDYIAPDLVPINVRICRSQEGQYVKWDILVTLQNQGGNANLEVSEAPLDVYVTFDPERPYGVNNETGESKQLSDYPDLLMDMPEQQFISVPRAGGFGGAAFSLWYPDGGPGSRYRRIPTRFDFMLDQFRGGNPGIVEESDEMNNGVSVIIDNYDKINGATGNLLIGCWYSSN